jgi:hypothetical protein
MHALALNEVDHSGSLEIALSVAADFGIKPADAKAIAGEVGEAVSEWRQAAARHNSTKAQIEQMSSAFDHKDLELALKNRAPAPARKLAVTPQFDKSSRKKRPPQKPAAGFTHQTKKSANGTSTAPRRAKRSPAK